LENHKSFNQESNEIESEEEDSDSEEEETPKACGKIGKRASRFSIYGQTQPLIEKTEADPEYSQITEVNESVMSESPRSFFGKELFKNGMFSGSNNEEDGNFSTPRSRSRTQTNMSEDEGLSEDELIWKSKYQEKLLNKALQSCSKFSLDGSNILKQSSFKQSNFNSVVETGFGKKENMISGDTLNAKSQDRNSHMNRISIENQLSGFKPKDSKDIEDLSHSPVPGPPGNEYGAPPVQLNSSSLPFKNVKLPKNIFSKKPMHETQYRDSCDINLESQKSVIKFYEHWKLTNQQEKNNGESTRTVFNQKDDTPSEHRASENQTNLKKLISVCSEDSNYYDIFNGCPDSNSNNNYSSSDVRSSFLSKSKAEPNGSSDKIKKESPNPEDKIFNDSKSQSSKKSNDSLFKQYSSGSKESKMGKNLLSELMTQTGKNSISMGGSLDNRDSIMVGNMSILSQGSHAQGWRNSAYCNSQVKRGSNFTVDNKIKKKYSMINSKINNNVRGSKMDSKVFKKTSTVESDPWSKVPSENQLITMLSMHSNASTNLSRLNSTEIRPDALFTTKHTTDESHLLESKETFSGNKKTSEETSGSMLFIKKSKGEVQPLQSRKSLEKPEGKEKKEETEGVVAEKTEPRKSLLMIDDTNKNLFEISKDPTEMTNFLGKEGSVITEEMNSLQSQDTLSSKSKKSVLKKDKKRKKKKKSKDYFEVITNFFLCRGCNTRFTF
jgi:hypothetical protein